MTAYATVSDNDLDSAVRRHVNFNVRIGANAVRARLLGQQLKVNYMQDVCAFINQFNYIYNLYFTAKAVVSKRKREMAS
jgi:hypothetical protein